MTTTQSESELRIKFFDLLFGENQGWLCIATKNPRLPKSGFQQKFFNWPNDYMKAEEYILRQKDNRDIYFCVNLLEKPERKKEFCSRTNLVWADLDTVDPLTIEPTPQIIIQSSKDRYQAVWCLTVELDPEIAENYSKRVAYKFNADRSGWDLTQLLRVPFTFNFKYNPPQVVLLTAAIETKVPVLLFEGLPRVEIEQQERDAGLVYTDLPKQDELPEVQQVIYKYSLQLRGTAFQALYSMDLAPEDDWSKPMWRLIHTLLEVGMNQAEVYAVVKDSPLNKFERDKRPASHLWRDILKAAHRQQTITTITNNFKPLVMPLLVDPDHEVTPSFVTQYREWAEEATDAVAAFHDLSAFILLSSVVSNSLRCETSYGPMVPNIWGMILGDSTLSRKTTAMRMVMDILNTLNPDMLLATDGSAEGLLGGLELRPNRTSIFFRDELSGFFDAINRKDYLAGMPETFTALYDVPGIYQRRLRKEVIRLESPVFIFFGGGVRDKIYEVSTEEYVTSGFLPRFLVVSGETDLSKLRRTGPANNLGIEKRASIVTRAADLYEAYAQEVKMSIGGQKIDMPPRVMAILTNDAWDTYGEIEEKLVIAANESSIPHLALPTFERLSRSTLKMAMILAAQRQMPIDGTIAVTEADVVDAAWYSQQWGSYSIDLIINTGKGTTEKVLDKIVNSIKKNPGVLRSTIMQHHHLTKREADDILNTLEDRMLVQKEKRGRGYSYWAI